MKPTASQAPKASRKVTTRLRHILLGNSTVRWVVLSMSLATAFFLGRETAEVSGGLERGVAQLRLQIQLQQRDVGRLLQENYSNINALTARVAELQASSTRIDALGERVAQMGQLTLDEFDFNQPVAVGGPADPDSLTPSSEAELKAAVGLLGEKLRRQASQLDALQSLMANRQMENELTPTGWPVLKGYISSRYGQRIDPFSGRNSSHHGVDFVGQRGSDVVSVANGVVVWAGNRSGYGRTIEIDHGNGYQTRYAHNESLVVEPGEQVTAGQVIAKLGSSGRASAPHVHFEVLQDGRSVNPAKFVGQLR